MRYIKPQITPPSPLILAPVLGASVWQVILAGSGFPHVANPPNTLAQALAWVGDDVRGEVWFGSLFQRLVVYDDFSKVTCDLALFLLESSSEFNCGSFDIFWDLGGRLIIAGQ